MSNTPQNNPKTDEPENRVPGKDLSNNLIDAISNYTDRRKKPKRNRSAFILFSIDLRTKIKNKELEDLNPNDKFVKIAEMWKEISDEERKIYEERARKEKERYTVELNDFCKIFPSEPIQRPRNHIKKPCNAYGFYLRAMKEEIRKEHPKMRMCEVLRVVSEKWKNLTPDDKQIYEKKAEAGRKNFKVQMNKQLQTQKKNQALAQAKADAHHHIHPPHKNKISPKKDKEHPRGHAIKHSEGMELVRKDTLMSSYEDYEPKEKKVHLNPSTNPSISLDQENIRPNLNHSNFSPLPSSNPIPEFPSNQSFPQRNTFQNQLSPINQLLASNHPMLGMNENPNNPVMFSLLDLYMRVDSLRNQILMQMQSATVSPTSINAGNLLNNLSNMARRIPLLEHANLNGMSQNQADIFRAAMERDGFKREDM